MVHSGSCFPMSLQPSFVLPYAITPDENGENVSVVTGFVCHRFVFTGGSGDPSYHVSTTPPN